MSAKKQISAAHIDREQLAAIVLDLECSLEVFSDIYSTASSLVTSPPAARSHLIACDRYLEDIEGAMEKLRELLNNGGAQ